MDFRLIFSAFFFASLCCFTCAIEIGQDGGYNLRLAIHQDEEEPSIGAAAYIENIKVFHQYSTAFPLVLLFFSLCYCYRKIKTFKPIL